jgi:kinesin family protein 6/9
MSAGRQEAFDHFRRDNPLNQKLEEHKRILKQRYTEAKTLGEEINQSRNRISNQHFDCDHLFFFRNFVFQII